MKMAMRRGAGSLLFRGVFPKNWVPTISGPAPSKQSHDRSIDDGGPVWPSHSVSEERNDIIQKKDNFDGLPATGVP